MAGHELARFADQEPGLASQCGIEISALEAKTLLGSGMIDRLSSMAEEAARMGSGFMARRQDLECINRLEGVVSLASSRIAQKYMAMEAADSGSAKLGTAISVISGVVGLVRQIF